MLTRRKFVQLVGFGVLAQSLPLPVRLQDGDEYEALSLGLRLSKPSYWRFVSAAEVDQLRREVHLPGGDAAKQAVLELAGSPLLVATRYAHPQRGPTLVVWRQPALESHHRTEDNREFALVHELTYRKYAPYLRDYEMISCGALNQFAGQPASRCVVQFGEDGEGGESWTVHQKSHMFCWRSSWFSFNFLDLHDGWSTEATRDFALIEASIRLFEPHIPIGNSDRTDLPAW